MKLLARESLIIGNYTVKQLVKLSERNDSILVLSSIPFYLTTVTSHNDILIPKPFTNSLSTAREEEALIYLAIGRDENVFRIST